MSFVQSFSLDRWSGKTYDLVEATHPALDETEAAFARLDGRVRTLLSLYGADASLMVGGGAGRYIVSHQFGDHSWTLTTPAAKAGRVLLAAGGQEGEYPEHLIVDRETALRALRAFFVDGSRDAGLDWEQD